MSTHDRFGAARSELGSLILFLFVGWTTTNEKACTYLYKENKGGGGGGSTINSESNHRQAMTQHGRRMMSRRNTVLAGFLTQAGDRRAVLQSLTANAPSLAAGLSKTQSVGGGLPMPKVGENARHMLANIQVFALGGAVSRQMLGGATRQSVAVADLAKDVPQAELVAITDDAGAIVAAGIESITAVVPVHVIVSRACVYPLSVALGPQHCATGTAVHQPDMQQQGPVFGLGKILQVQLGCAIDEVRAEVNAWVLAAGSSLDVVADDKHALPLQCPASGRK